MLNGSPFSFGGANNNYLGYGTQTMVDDVLQSAVAMDFRVIRTWGAIDMGSRDGTVRSVYGNGTKMGVYYQYWDTSSRAPAYNDSSSGLKHLDYVVARAGKLGLKLVIVLVDNWYYFGGMDQYVTWYNLPYHDDFYRSSLAKQAYKNWVLHLVNHVNSVNGIRYRDDPAIMSWELANELSCNGSGVKPTSSSCSASLLTSWASEMSSFVKSADPNHMVSVGDVGAFKRTGTSDAYYNGFRGDFDALVRLPTVDFGTFHMYPDYWSKSLTWCRTWIADHVAAAKAAGKPVLFEEFGLMDAKTRDSVYKSWTDAFRQSGGSGFTFWMLGGKGDDGKPFPYDAFTVYYGSSTTSVLATAAGSFTSPLRITR